MKRKVLLFVLLSAISMCVKAQIRSSEACFYLEAGKDPNSTASAVWEAISFRGNNAVLKNDGEILGRIRSYLKKNVNYYEDVDIIDTKNGWIYVYDSSLSTDSYFVYKRTSKYYSFFLAFSKDNSHLIRWREKNDEILDKRQFIRVEKSEVMPKGVNRDFLE